MKTNITEAMWRDEYRQYQHLFADYHEWKAWMIAQQSGPRPAGDDMGVGILRTIAGCVFISAAIVVGIVLLIAAFCKA